MSSSSDESAFAPTVAVEESSAEPVAPPELGLRKIDRKRVFAALFDEGSADPEPQTYGRFEVGRRLGRGGMGTVLEARDPKLDRTVAIKVLHETAGGQHQQRLLREAQALAQLSHPNVVQVFETGEAAGRLFIAMELVRGQTLRDWHQQPHAWQDCLEVYMQAGQGLAAAHAVGIVHRDFKPANCIIDDEGRVRVLDFGLARGHAEEPESESEPGEAAAVPASEVSTVREGDSGGTGEQSLGSKSSSRAVDQRLTRTGALLGTPAYMAPEQAQRGPTDACSDQFSFCVALYEALLGQRPFDGIVGLLELIDGARPSFEAAPSHEGLPRLPAWLRHVISRGLEPRPGDRFPSMGALLAVIEERLVARRRRRIARGMLVGLGVAAVIVSGLVAAGLALRDAQRESECEAQGGALNARWSDASRTELARAFDASGAADAASTWSRVEPRIGAWTQRWREARIAACLQAHDTPEPARLRGACLEQERWEVEALLDIFGDPDRTVVIEAVMAVADLPRVERCDDLAWLEADVSLRPSDPQREADSVALRRDLAQVFALERTGRYDEALALASTSVDSAGALEDPVVEAEALAKLGAIRWRRAEFGEAEQALRTSHFLAGRVEHDRVAYATARDLAWVVGVRLARPSEGRLWLEHARMNLARTGEDPEAEPELLVMLGELEFAEGRAPEALVAHRRALALREERLGAEHPEIADSLINVARIEAALGDDRARHTLERGRALAEAALGTSHPMVANADNELGVLLFRLGEFEQSIAAYRRAIATRERALGLDDSGLASMLSNLAAALRARKELSEARPLLERAHGILERTLGPDHPDALRVEINLASIEGKLGDGDAAVQRLRGVLQRVERVLEPDDPLLVNTLSSLATWIERTGDHTRALSLRQRALELDMARHGADSDRLVPSLRRLARAQLRLGHAEAALLSYERALSIVERTRGPEHSKFAKTLDDIALALLALGRIEAAAAHHARAVAAREATGKDGGDPNALNALREKLAALQAEVGPAPPRP